MGVPVLRRLLAEISWEGRRSRMYHDGGRGKENVLSAEVFQALDMLPRQAFLGNALAAAHGAYEAREQVRSEAEHLSVDFLPGDVRLANDLAVQPDVVLRGTTTLTFIEAKARGRAVFHPGQLAREYRVLLAEAAKEPGPASVTTTPTPLLLVVLGQLSPVRVRGRGRFRNPAELLESELLEADPVALGGEFAQQRLVAQLRDVLAWTTWEEMSHAVAQGLPQVLADERSVLASIERQALALMEAVDWHTRR